MYSLVIRTVNLNLWGSMRKYLFLAASLLTAAMPLSAFTYCEVPTSESVARFLNHSFFSGCDYIDNLIPEDHTALAEFRVGYRHDSLEFSARNRSWFDSRANWNDLNIWQIGGYASYLACDRFFFQIYGDYGWITSGDLNVRDGDPYLHIPTDFDVSGEVYDISIALGYRFGFYCNSFGITPLVGYLWEGRNIDNNHHRFCSCWSSSSCSSSSSSSDRFISSSSSSSSCSSSSSSFDENATYNSRWNGPWVGIDFSYQACGCFNVYADYEFHWAKYRANAKHLLPNTYPEDLAPHGFKQLIKDTNGNFLRIGVEWNFCGGWTGGIEGEYQWWEARGGYNTGAHTNSCSSLCEDCSPADLRMITFCAEESTIKKLTWNTAIVTVNIGYSF